ncbi:MAG: dihydrofolate reductase family protein [Syntrophothermus sp.]
MGKLVYSALCSLDGYVEDERGGFEWAAPDAEVHAFVNAEERPIGTYLYGRGMYETMSFWETVDTGSEDSAEVREYAEIWRAADKVVYSRSLESVGTRRTRLEREFDPQAVRALKEGSERDLSIGGSGLAGMARGAGLVDEVRLVLVPVAVGGGKPALPAGARLDLELLDQRRFAGGAVHLSYRVG